MGGEAHAIFTPATKITFPNEGGTTQTACAGPIAANPAGIVDFNGHYAMPGAKVAYAFAWIDSPADHEVLCFLGSGDGVKVWLGGKLIQTKPASLFEQSCIPRQVQFKAGLRKGRTPLLVKVSNGGGDWAFILELASTGEGNRIKAELDGRNSSKISRTMSLGLNRPPV